MAGVVFFFEDNDVDIFSGRRVDLSAWNYAIKSAGDIERVIIINRTSTSISCFDDNLESFEVVDSMPKIDGKVVHLVCPWDFVVEKTSLWDFDHNVDWYVFGPADGWGAFGEVENGVTVPMSGRGALHSVHIASTVMLHRYGVRQWQLQQ